MRPRVAVAIIGAALAMLATFGAAGAHAGSDSWSCLSRAGVKCASPYRHHEEYVVADYYGSGDLPLLAGSYCQEAACGGSNNYIFYETSGGFSPPAYNHVIACYMPISCGTNSPYLGRGHAENRHSSWHTVHGQDSF